METYVQRKKCYNLHKESPKKLAGIGEPMVPTFGGLANIDAKKVSKHGSQISKFWIFVVDFSGKKAYSLVCNMWKVDTRPISASDFLF
jgi:hypothetical protein